MWYIYQNGKKISYSPTEPTTAEYFTIEKLPPIPSNKYMELHADFENQIVWFEKRELTEEEIKEERANKIKVELEELDKTINRATEDLYTLTNSTPYASVAEVISRKNELRQELKEVL
jgi:hypothetical protein